ncbi:glycosyltransferase [Roseomonas aerophila]|uniref:Glycosyltransferase n=1 Tax=Teichococcus aerophilus TaxID=1224513 RepID=A0ABR7RLG7_9PROT|nr:glycosyltransferase [Pseudoroseomonas aerophila]
MALASGSRILFGVTTFNRLDIVALAARSLSHAAGVADAAILVIDDASTDYDLDALRPLFPPHAKFIRRPVNSGRADYAAHELLRVFREERVEDILVCLDSDLLVAEDVIATLQAAFPRTDGLLSLLNAPSHPGTLRNGLLVKRSVGFAGTAWSRDVVAEVLEHVQPSPRYDWDICEHLVATGREIFCLPDSAVQHLGFAQGQNSHFLRADYGLSFTDTNWWNVSAIQETLLFGVRQEFRNVMAHAMGAAEMRGFHALLERQQVDTALAALAEPPPLPAAVKKQLSAQTNVAKEREAAEHAILAGLARPGWICLDVAQDAGQVALLLSRCVGPGGQVHAFGSTPMARGKLRAQAEMLGLGNLAMPEALVANRVGSVQQPDTSAGEDGPAVPTPVVTLDGYVAAQGITKVHLLRLGIPGQAGAALEGAYNLISQQKPYIVLDVSHTAGEDPAPVKKLLNRLRMAGYTLCGIRRNPWPHVRLLEAPDYAHSFHHSLFCYHGPRNDAHV